MKNTMASTYNRRILTLCFLVIASSSIVLRAADPEEIERGMMAAMTSQQLWGEPYELDGNRIVFTNWYFIRPGNILWLNDDDDFVNTLEEGEENPVYGPWDVRLERPSSPFGIEIVVQPAERVGPIIERENPWEEGYIIFKTVLKDGDIYKA